jgi:NAD(P)-dependent dehydrogenase (short-subunit alcohol dehydrogenase family)
MKRLQDKICFITGAANGIGQAIAQRFAEEGAVLLLTDIDEAGGAALAQSLSAAGCKVVFKHHDVTSESDWEAMFAFVQAEFGGLDVMVNNAGGGTYNDIESLTLEQWRFIMQLNLDSAFLGTQGAVAMMKESGGGSIINLSSVGGLVGSPNLAAYSSAKAGVKLLSKCAAIHCGQNAYNIRVNSLHPGLVKTESGIDMATKATGMTAQEAEDAFAAMHPIGRIGNPVEIANAALYLASDEASFTTGSELVVDGGYTSH